MQGNGHDFLIRICIDVICIANSLDQPFCSFKMSRDAIALHLQYMTKPLRQWGRDKMAETKFSRRHFQTHFFNEDALISIKISLKFVPMGPINTIPALVQIMAWRRPGDKPLSEPMMVSLLTHICVTRPQWVNQLTQMFDAVVVTYKWHRDAVMMTISIRCLSTGSLPQFHKRCL